MGIGNEVSNMKRMEQIPMEPPGETGCETGGETAIDTQVEVDLICGGVGFDDGPAGEEQWLKDLRNKQKSSKETENKVV